MKLRWCIGRGSVVALVALIAALGDARAIAQRRGLRHGRADHASSSGSCPTAPRRLPLPRSSAPGEPYTVRQELARRRPDRAATRTSLAYFGQLSDFQLADEESPARVEVIDPLSTPLNLPFDAAWRPWEALEPQIDDAMIRQMNQFAGGQPGRRRQRRRTAPMDFTIDTGDSADSQQLNETEWVRTLLEGGTLNPNSGVDKTDYSHPLCPNLLRPRRRRGRPLHRRPGLRRLRRGRRSRSSTTPTARAAPHAAWPKYPGLMDQAQQSFTAAGLDVPSYVAFGNHDALVQGNAAANAAFEAVATGCLKPIGPVPNPENAAALLTSLLNPTNLLSTLLTNPQNLILVPGDPKRRFVSKKQYKDVFKAGSQADGHGFDLRRPGAGDGLQRRRRLLLLEPDAGHALHRPRHRRRGGHDRHPDRPLTADGNIDDPQFKWLRGQLKAATAADELVVLFSHHAPESLTADAPDELAPPCTAQRRARPRRQPRLRPRPAQLAADPPRGRHGRRCCTNSRNAIAWVAGHSHVNVVDPFPEPERPGGFWSIRVAAEADWPQQSRLLQVFDNHDGTLSIFGTILDHVGQSAAPPPGTPATGMDLNDLASVGRTMSFNDLQSGAPDGEGEANDRNVELLVPDPR